MSLNTIQKVGITVGAVVTSLGAAYGVASVVEDTPCGANAAVADCKFKIFVHKNKNNPKVADDQDYKAVFAFFKKPWGARLVATPAKDTTSGKITWTYKLIAKENWKDIKKNKEALKGLKDTWNNKDNKCKLDWEAVWQFLKDHKAEKEQPAAALVEGDQGEEEIPVVKPVAVAATGEEQPAQFNTTPATTSAEEEQFKKNVDGFLKQAQDAKFTPVVVCCPKFVPKVQKAFLQKADGNLEVIYYRVVNKEGLQPGARYYEQSEIGTTIFNADRPINFNGKVCTLEEAVEQGLEKITEENIAILADDE